MEFINTGIYVRVSTEEQRDYGYSIEAQLRELRNYCNQRNLNIIHEYNDAGYSAKDLKRPEMERMIDDIKHGRINLVVAMKVDRLTREGYDGQWFLKFCKENNCGLILLQENYDVTTPDGEMMYGMSLLFGQKERREIRNRTRRAMEEAIKQGKYPAKTPMGYNKNEDKKLEINIMEAEVIKDVFELYSKGNNASQVAKIMKDNNRYIKNGEKWTEGRITRIINNPIYSGDLLWGIYNRNKKNQILIPNHSPAIISKELWNKCQSQRDKYSHGNYGEHTHIFHRVIRCPECKEFMSTFLTVKHQNKKKKYNYYVRCNNKSCTKKGTVYNASKIEKELVSILNDLSGIALLSNYSLNFPIIDDKEDIEKIKGALTKIKNDENKLLDYFLTSQIQSNALTNRLNTLASERKELEKKKVKMEFDITLTYNKDLISLYNDKNLTDIEGINPIWSILSREGKKEVISSFIKFIDVSIDNNYNIKIESINFNNEFLQNKFYNISDYLLDKFKDKYKNINYLGICNKLDISKLNLNKDYEIYSYNELTKNYSQDRKTFDLIQNKFQELNLNLMMVIDNNKFVDSLILFERVRPQI